MRPHADAQEGRAAEVTPPVRPHAPWRVAHMEVLSGFRLRVRFNDGTEGTVELAGFPIRRRPAYLRSCGTRACFVRPGSSSGAVSWPENLDLAPDAMHREIKEHGRWIVQ